MDSRIKNSGHLSTFEVSNFDRTTPLIAFALALLAVSVALMLTDGSLQHRCVHVTGAIDLGGHCGSVP